MHIVVGSRHRQSTPCHTPAGEGADLYLRFGVEGDAQCFWVLRGLRVNVLEVLEDGIGFGDFF